MVLGHRRAVHDGEYTGVNLILNRQQIHERAVYPAVGVMAFRVE
jgi:hypothetical protein